jgi:hypothetical protein
VIGYLTLNKKERMSEVQFEDDRVTFHRDTGSGSKMIDFLIKKGIVKSSGQAMNILIGMVIIFIGVAIYFFYYTMSITNIDPNDPRFKLNEEQILLYPPEVQDQIRNSQNK